MSKEKELKRSEFGRIAEKALQESGRKEIEKRMKLGFRSVVMHNNKIHYIMPDGSLRSKVEVDAEDKNLK